MPSVDELFPEQAKSVDELFPIEVERDRYRRQTLGTSPIQDLIFGDTSVNPVARVLDHFGQGARQGWGADPNGLSDESANALKKAGIFNDYDKGQRSIIKAMNESMFRGAATYLADPVMRGLPALFRGTQEAVAQVGVEAGQPKLGREAAAAFEAFPTGVRAPTGIPHAPVKYVQSELARGNATPAADRVMAADEAQRLKDEGGAETRILMAEIERARDLKTIGAGESGWKGTVEPVRTEAPIVRQEFDSGMHQPVEASPGEVTPAAARTDQAVRTPEPAANRGMPVDLFEARPGGKGPEKYTITDPLGAATDGEKMNVEVLRSKDGNIEGLYTDRGVVKVGPAYRGLSPEEAIAATLGDHPDGTAPDISKVSKAEPPAPAVARPIDASHPIAQDISKRLVAAGRPAQEASATGQIIASHYEARAARFEGALGTADELYAREGADIRGPNGRPAGGAAVEPIAPEPGPSRGGAVELPTEAVSAVSRWDEFIAERQGKRETASIQTGYNPETTKSGAQLRGKASQVWEPGNVVDVGFVKNLLIAGKNEDGSFTLLSKPDKSGQSKSYEVKPHEGLGASKPVDFMDATKDLTPKGQTPATPSAKAKARNSENWSLLPFLASEGGLKPTADLQSIFGGKNPFIPGFGKLFRKDGLTMDEALTRAKENSYVLDPNDIQHTSGVVNKGENTIRWQDLQDKIAEEAGGNKQYRNTRSAEPTKVNKDEEFRHISDDLHRQVEESGGSVADIDPVTERRVVEMIQKGEAPDVLSAYERAIMEVEYNQIMRGKIRLRNGEVKPIITLFKDANESTFIHETGHQWLEELVRDAAHPKAPEGLLADSRAVLDWFGVEKASDIKTRHHEQFARGFERYMMEGVAPSRELAGVFAKFKDWLTKIYQVVERLKSPINDEIRGVFDRLIAQNPEKVRIEPDAPKSFADIHEADALHTTPEASHPVAQTIRAERDRLATEQIPEEHDARLEGVASGASRREAGGPQPVRDVTKAPRPEEAGNNKAPGEVSPGGSNVAPEGAGPSTVAGKTEAPVNPNETFKTPDSDLIDKAGNIRLDNLGTAEDVNTAIRDAAAANNDFIDARRGVVTDGQVLELADALGMDAGQLNQRKLGQAFNAEQIMAARKLLIQSATTVRDAMIKAAEGKEADVLAYAEAKSRHRLIQEQVSGITAEAGRALRAFRKLEGQQEAVQIDAFLKDATGKTLFQLQREAQLGLQLETPAQVSKFVNDVSKPTWKEMVIEAWMAALLSGPKTHMANIVGNAIAGTMRLVEGGGAAAIGKARNLITGSQDRVHFGEVGAELFGMMQGAKEGVVAGYKAFKTEEPQLTDARQIEQGYRPRALPSASINIRGHEIEVGGKQARIPLRLLGAEDEFFKAVAFRGDINRQAYSLAMKENLPAEQFHVRVAELVANPTEAMVSAAKEVADYQTFQTPLGKVGRAVQNFSNSHIAAKLILPFVRTPANLLKYAGERTPLGLFAQEVRDNLSGKNGAAARDTQASRIALGTMVGLAAFELASQGVITGGGPADKGKKAIMQADGWQEYSIRVGDMYYRYSRLDPFSIILGVAADAYEINKAMGADHPEKERLASLVFASVTQNVLNRASLQGISDVIRATSDPERYGLGYLKSMAGTIVPAISAQTAQTMDPVVRETRTVLDRLKSRIPGLSQDLMPKRDVWGEPVMREGGLGPDIASPIAESRLKNDPVNKALIGANYFPGKLDRKIRGVELTDQQYDDYSRIAGRTAKMRLDMIVKMPGFEQMPEGTRKELMTNAVTTSREMARSLIMMQNPDIIKKANDAKVMKLRSEKATP